MEMDSVLPADPSARSADPQANPANSCGKYPVTPIQPAAAPPADRRLIVIRRDLGLVQGLLERAAVWLEAGQKRLPEAV